MTKIPSPIMMLLCMLNQITRQTFNYANQIPCKNSPQNVLALDPDTDQYYFLTPQLNKKDPP